MKMFLFSDNKDTYVGMRLAGVDGVIVRDEEETQEQLNRVLKDQEVGILLVTEFLAQKYQDIFQDIKMNRRLPLLVEIPDRHGMGRNKNFITDYVNEAIGLKL
jgi:V/A-type H+-transporting ATPase subunit F